MPIEYFAFLKIIHIGSLIFWLGPSLGAWCCLMIIRKQEGEYSTATQKLYQLFIKFLILEHVAFAGLLGSGICMAYFWFGFQPWLQWKLFIILCLIIPLEALDIWYGNIKLGKLFSKKAIVSYTAEETRLLNFYHRYITSGAIIILPVVLLAILWLVVAKPALSPIPF